MAGSNQFLWKPAAERDRNLVVLTPSSMNNQLQSAGVLTPDGKFIKAKYSGIHNENRKHWRFPQTGSRFPAGSQFIGITKDGKALQFPPVSRPGSRYTADNPTPKVSDANSIVPGSFEGAQTEGSQPAQEQQGGGGRPRPNETINPIKFPGRGGNDQEEQGESGDGPPLSSQADNDLLFNEYGFAAPQVDFSGLTFDPIEAPEIPRIETPFVDSLDRTKEVAGFNTQKFQEFLNIGGENALNLTELEFRGLQSFNRQARKLQQEGIIDENQFNQLQFEAANKFNQGEVESANRFNQEERLTQFDNAMPGVRDIMSRQIERGATLSEGRFLSEAEDRAFEVASRNTAADGNMARGFGDDSVVGRRASELLSAEQRLKVSQVGENTVDRFTQLAATLTFDQPIKQNPVLQDPLTARTSQDVRGAPSVSASELATQQQGALTALGTIDPSQAIQFDIGQNQFQSQLDRDADKVNSSYDFQAQTFNSEMGFNVMLEQLYGEVFNAQQEAGLINLGVDTTRIDLAQAEERRRQQRAQRRGAFGQILGGLINAGVDLITGGAGTAVKSGDASSLMETGTKSISTDNFIESSNIGETSGLLEKSFRGGSPATLESSNIGRSLGLMAAAFGQGMDLAGLVGGLQDGSVSMDDVTSSIGELLGGNVGSSVASQVRSNPFNGDDLQRASMLSNPSIAPLAMNDATTAMGAQSNPIGARKRSQLRDFGTNNLGLFTEGKPSENGLAPGSTNVKLASGAFYNIGLEGGALPNYGINAFTGKKERSYSEVDWSDPRAVPAVEMLAPASLMLFGADHHNMVGHLFNASISDNKSLSSTKNNIASMIGQSGITYQGGLTLLQRHKEAGNISQDQYESYLGGWGSLLLSDNPAEEIRF